MSSQQEIGPYIKPFAFILRLSKTLINEYSDNLLLNDESQNYHLVAKLMRIFHNFNFQVNYILYWWFHLENEISWNCLLTKWKWTYILHFGPWNWGALHMSYVGKVFFKNARATFFRGYFDVKVILNRQLHCT